MSANPTERIERVIAQLGWLGQRQFMQLLAEPQFELTVPQFHTLQHLVSTCDVCNMSDLARATHQSAASLTGVVDRLIDKQLAERVRPNDDRRQVMVAATERGHTVLGAIKQARYAHMHIVLQEANGLDVDALLGMLDTLLESMRKIAELRDQGS